MENGFQVILRSLGQSRKGATRFGKAKGDRISIEVSGNTKKVSHRAGSCRSLDWPKEQRRHFKKFNELFGFYSAWEPT